MSSKTPPSMDAWLQEAKALEGAGKIGMYLVHNGVVRATAKARVRQNDENARPVAGMRFCCDADRLNRVIADAYKLEGVCHIRAWLNEGELQVGDDLMYLLIGGDIRPHVTAALDYLLGRIKGECVTETEIYE